METKRHHWQRPCSHSVPWPLLQMPDTCLLVKAVFNRRVAFCPNPFPFPSSGEDGEVWTGMEGTGVPHSEAAEWSSESDRTWATEDLCQLTVRWNQSEFFRHQTPAKSLWRPQVPQGGCLGHIFESSRKVRRGRRQEGPERLLWQWRVQLRRQRRVGRQVGRLCPGQGAPWRATGVAGCGVVQQLPGRVGGSERSGAAVLPKTGGELSEAALSGGARGLHAKKAEAQGPGLLLLQKP
ncbi:uncharacterized protein LOC117287134 [Fukomys damarensis]|uniref:uncharacterized protein LOC117287134 n=1 Tax=Fukomys damarensis TaxID=885580 RepID=UPI00145530B9|nr:uncharacterized protein LOC117287134 [Fukomys damarensis]